MDVLSLFIVFQLFLGRFHQKCTMRGAVSATETFYYNGSSEALDMGGTEIFEKYCSSMLSTNHTVGGEIKACCDTSQLIQFKDNVESLDLLIPDCEICKENILRLSCNLICNENQSDFTSPILDPHNATLVTGLNFSIYYEMAKGIFDSCSEVLMVNSNSKIINTLCDKSLGPCGPENLITTLMLHSDFTMNPTFLYNASQIKPPLVSGLFTDTYECNGTYKTFNGVINKCSCSDCHNTCPIPNIPVDAIPKIINLVLYHFTLICVYSAVTMVLVVMFLFRYFTARHSSVLYDSPSLDFEDNSEAQQIDPESNPLLDYEHVAFKNQYRFMWFVRKMLMKWGVFVATYPVFIILFSLVLPTILCSGIYYHFKITSDPVKLWSPPNSEFNGHKDFFNKNFGPFYRTEQIIVTTPGLNYTTDNINTIDYKFGPPIKKEIIDEVFWLQESIANISVRYPPDTNSNDSITYMLKDICVKPTSPLRSECAMFSITQYFQNNHSMFKPPTATGEDWRLHLDRCTFNPYLISDKEYYNIGCLGDFGGPMEAKIILGGYDINPIEANSLVITYMIENHLNESLNGPALAWEMALLAHLKAYTHPNITISYSTERSIQDEIDRQPREEVKSVVISYIVMFAYVCLGLGTLNFRGFHAFFIEQKIVLGFLGVLMVLVSVVSSIGLFCYLKYEINMIVLEVLPFLALAIGVDNIFLLVHQYSKLTIVASSTTPIPMMVGHVLANVGQGMLASVIAQVVTFCIGSISNIPAVKLFSLFAATTMAINFFMQMTFFLAIFTLDAMRKRAGRLDFIFCIKDNDFHSEYHQGLIEMIFEGLSKLILSRMLKPFILLSFIGLWFSSLYVTPTIKLGLDQTQALPTNSYLLPYFKDIFKYLKTGPPVYFMVYPGYHYEIKSQLNHICSGKSCDPNSLTNQIYQYSFLPQNSTIATSAYSWVDTYASWLKAPSSSCCYFKVNTTTNATEFCPSYSRLTDKDCKPCFSLIGEITSDNFSYYLPWFLADIPTMTCPFGGKPLFGRSVILNPDFYERNNKTAPPVLSSAFMSFHTSLVKSEDFITAIYRSFYLAENISQAINHTVVPYSMFYVYYESYKTIWRNVFVCFALSFVVVTIVNSFMYAFDLRMIVILTGLTCMMSAVDMGYMYYIDLNLNPVSLVNLIMFVGINLEFIFHIGRSYLFSRSPSRTERAQSALTETGSAVFTGVTLTKVLGIAVLSMTKSELFKMYMGAILFAALHGLVALPVILSYVGPINRFMSTDDDDNFMILSND